MNHSKKPAVHRAIQNLAEQSVLPVRLDDAIAVGHINALALDFQNGSVMDMHPDRLLEKVPEGKVMVATEQMDGNSRLDKLS